MINKIINILRNAINELENLEKFDTNNVTESPRLQQPKNFNIQIMSSSPHTDMLEIQVKHTKQLFYIIQAIEGVIHVFYNNQYSIVIITSKLFDTSQIISQIEKELNEYFCNLDIWQSEFKEIL